MKTPKTPDNNRKYKMKKSLLFTLIFHETTVPVNITIPVKSTIVTAIPSIPTDMDMAL